MTNKTIIGVNLFGGPNHVGMLVPYDVATYDAVDAIRPNFLPSRATLAATALTPSVALPGGKQYALAPALAPLKAIWDAGKMAIILNVGNLIEPLTKAEYLAGTKKIPPQLMSHNDQSRQIITLGRENGVGGRFGDVASALNSTTSLTCINLGYIDQFNVGDQVQGYSIDAVRGGPTPLFGNATTIEGSTLAMTTMRTLMTAPRTSLIAKEYARITARSSVLFDQVTAALATAPAFAGLFDDHVHHEVRRQARLAAQLIAVAEDEGVERMVLYVNQGGYDTHSNELVDLPAKLEELASGIADLWTALGQIGAQNKVVIEIFGDFGRTLTRNDTGSDHGWGTFSFVIGGEVAGGRYYGTNPVLADNGPDDFGQGRLVPTMSHDQVKATIAKWFGLSDAERDAALPNLVNFAVKDLGFFAQAPIGNARAVGTGDSISVGNGGGGGVGALNQMTFPPSVVINNLGANSTLLEDKLTDVNGTGTGADGILKSRHQADRPCVHVMQAGTNDIGRFANGQAGTSGANLYHETAVPLGRASKAQGFYTAICTIPARLDAFMTPAKQQARLDYNALVRANTGGFDRVIDVAAIAQLADPNNATYFTDLLHLSAAAQALVAPVLQSGLDPLVRSAPRAPTAVNHLIETGGDAYALDPTFGRALAAVEGNKFFVDAPIFAAAPPASFTVECFIQTTDNRNTVKVIAGQSDPANSALRWYLGIAANGNAAFSTSSGVNVVSAVNVRDGAPHHMRLAVTPAGGRLYVDGVQVAQNAVAITAPSRLMTLCVDDNTGFGYSYVGLLRDVAIFTGDKGALPVPTDGYAAGTADLLAYYPLAGHRIGWK